MKYLSTLLIYSRFIIISAVMLAMVGTVSSPVYAAGSSTTLVTCNGGPSFSGVDSQTHNGSGEACLVKQYINPAVRVLSGLVAVFVVLSIVIAGVQYSAAADDSSKVAAAKGRIQKAIIALLAYLFLLAFLQYILPGGLQ